MAVPASAKRKPAPAALRVVNGRGVRRDGRETDSGGRPIERGPAFRREAPVKPDGLSPDAAELWDLVCAELETVGLLKPLDAPALEMACETFARWRGAVRLRREHGVLAVNSQGQVAAPWCGVEERAAREFRSWAAEFGFTPAAEKALARAAGDDGAGGGADNPF